MSFGKKREKLIVGFFVMVFITIEVIVAVGWIGYNTEYNGKEDTPYFHNLSDNISDPESDMVFSVDTQETEIKWNGELINYEDISSWVYIINSSTGNFTINSSQDNHTGYFRIPFKVTWNSGQSAATESFNFSINATNDHPEFTNINNSYELNATENFYEILTGSDEANESHFPLRYNITFIDNCSHASWSGRTDDQNCSLFELGERGFNLTDIPNTDASMNFTPTTDDVGEYWANVSVMDAGASSSCPHSYCEADYETNKTTWQVVNFNILSALDVNISNCSGSVFQEGQEGTCHINIHTKYSDSTLKMFSNASLRNPSEYSQGQLNGWINDSWFYTTNSANASGNSYTVNINVTPEKTEIGNWTINFTTKDLDSGKTESHDIYIYVNKTTSPGPVIGNINNLTTSRDSNEEIDFNISDNDFLIPDTNEAYGGFNESLNFTLEIYNRSNLSQTIPNSGNFDTSVVNMPVPGTNRTEAKVILNPNSSDVGEYTFNISVIDTENNTNYGLFNVTILGNEAPNWTEMNQSYVLNESDSFELNISEYVNDSEGDDVDYSYSLESGDSFVNFESGFNSETGVISFTPDDEEVGNHTLNISVFDEYHIETREFNFTIFNVNDNPSIETLGGNSNLTYSGLNIDENETANCTEDDFVTLTLSIEDDDFNIPDSQVSQGFYRENITIDVNFTGGNNNNLFSFSYSYNSGNRIYFTAEFTPNSTDVGVYNITINATDNSGVYVLHDFVLNINEKQDPPSIDNVQNLTTIVNESFYYDFNGTDEEDGNDSLGNLEYIIEFLSGENFIDGNESIFNSTTGVFNMSFNDTQDGKYHINITLNDTSGKKYIDDFWIYVYGSPELNSPLEESVFNLTENVTSFLEFNLSHAVGDNLSYDFYIDSISCSLGNSSNCSFSDLGLRESEENSGDGSIFNWSFTPNWTDETYTNQKNLTIKVYPATNSLNQSQKNNLSINKTFKLNINHTNHPIEFTNPINDLGPVSYGSAINLDLSNHFTDYDYFDSYYNEPVNFSYLTNASPTSRISVDINEDTWSIEFTANQNADITELFNVTANESGNTVNSDYFLVKFTEAISQNVPTPSGGGGSSRVEVEKPVMLKIIFPEDISVIETDQIAFPITLSNNGTQQLNKINLSGFVAKDSVLREDFNISFTKDYFESLAPGENKSSIMHIEVGRVGEGTFEISVNATVEDPNYQDWGKMYLRVTDLSDVEERLLFASEFILENPECAELQEIITEGESLLKDKKYDEAYDKAVEAIDACKKLMASSGKSAYEGRFPLSFYQYTAYISSGLIFLFIIYYFYRRYRLKPNKYYEQNLSS